MTPQGLASGGLVVALVYALRYWWDYRRGTGQDADAMIQSLVQRQQDTIDKLSARVKDLEETNSLLSEEVAVSKSANVAARSALALARKHPDMIESIVDQFLDD